MSDQPDVALGIDIGGTGTKGGLVDISSGSLVSQRYRLDTPQPATPTDVSDVVAAVAARFDFAGPVGVAFPGVVLDGVAHTAANLDDRWIGSSLHQLIGPRLDGPSTFLNDADAAGLAEAHYGAARASKASSLSSPSAPVSVSP